LLPENSSRPITFREYALILPTLDAYSRTAHQ
jgi:hypothetical protein